VTAPASTTTAATAIVSGMRTLGVDLASQPDKTAVCIVEWHVEGRARIAEQQIGADDETVLALAARCDAVGIDAPFGWPDAFRDAMAGARADPWSPEVRDRLRFRRTDHDVRRRTGRWPLSVSTDLVGVVALRCRGLLERLGVTDRAGGDGVFEVYPAAALRTWDLPATGYKGPKGRAVLPDLVDAFARAAPWWHGTPEQRAALSTHDDAFDAFVAAVVARAARCGGTEGPAPAAREVAAREGWVHVPHVPLAELA